MIFLPALQKKYSFVTSLLEKLYLLRWQAHSRNAPLSHTGYPGIYYIEVINFQTRLNSCHHPDLNACKGRQMGVLICQSCFRF